MEKFVIVDGNSLINRAFYALPMLRSLSGKPCNAVYGFLNMILNVITKENPKYFVCVFDAGKHTFRHNLYAEYKGTRDKMPEDLATQLPMLKDILKAMGIFTIEMTEIEADDLVGSFSRKFKEEFILISGDKDLLQLVNDNTSVWLTQKGISNVLKVDVPTLKQEFGIEPYQVVEMKSIMGDSSDNIPGVPHIGKLGAEDLISQFGSLDNIYNNFDAVPNKYKSKLQEGKELAYLSHTLATIKTDVELNVELKDCEYSLPFNKTVYDMLAELDFKSILSRDGLFNNPTSPVQENINLKLNFEKVEIDDNATFNEMLKALRDSFALASDDLGFYIACDNKEYVLYKSGTIFNMNIDKFANLLVGDKQKICFDCKTIMHELASYNLTLKNYFDVSVAMYIANEMDAEITLADALKLNNIETNSSTGALIKLKEIYVGKLINHAQLKLYSEIELPLVEVLFDMEQNGLKVSVEEIKNLSALYHEELNDLTKKIYDLAGETFNINSPKQLQTILFDKLNIEYKGKKGTSIEVLEAISDKHEIVDYIIRYRKINKLIGTYLDGMLACVGDDNKIHTTYMQRTTSTGRLSSREPNLQNLPIRDEEGKSLRKMFVSSFDAGSMISADYNQIELRLLANFSGDKNMVADYVNGKDIHTATASKIFGVDEANVVPSMRRTAKTVNFGIVYGISAFGLSQSLKISPKEAGAFINKYFEVYPRVKEYGEELIAKARNLGYATTIMGRVRHILDINSSNHVMRGFAERTAKNMPLQGSASDIIKMAMIRVNERIKQEKLHSKLVLQIHDELVVDCCKGESEHVKNILKQEMENVVKLEVPLLVEINEGNTLFEAH